MPTPLKQRFGRRLAQLRQARDLTQAELAERVDVSVETISHIERGIFGPRFDLLERLAQVLGCAEWELFWFDQE